VATESDTETTRIDVLIIANHAEAINGLLYLSGAGWSDLHRIIQDGNAPVSHFGIGISVRIPWHETDDSHKFVLDIENEDATVNIVHAEGQVKVGRPPQLPRGAVQHAVLSVDVNTTFPGPGGYRVIARIDDGKSTATWPFRVHDQHLPKAAATL
jgi:hypothetical protein